MKNVEPIFITGPDRSGTSLLFALLASHPRISMVRRTNMWRWFYGQYGDLSDSENFENCLNAMLNYQRLEHLHPDAERIRREFKEGEPSYGRLFALFHEHNAERVGKPRWGDKSLHTEHYVDNILKEFPNAKLIHMLRDPRDRYASVMKRYKDRKKGIGSITGRWLASTKVAKRNLANYPDNVILLRYETLASEPEVTIKMVCDFIGEAFDPVMMSMQGAPEHSSGNSSFEDFQPRTISTKSIGRFRKVLDQKDIAFMQTCVGRDMVAFDYALDPIELSAADRSMFYLVDLPVNYIRMTGWMTKNRYADKRGQSVPEHRLKDSNQ